MKIKFKIIIGLGNPDKEYEKTYHNVGFLAVDFFAKNPPISKLLKSDVFMNQSGNFVKTTLNKYKINPENLLVVQDDSDIEIGKYKLSFGRGSAGHKGIESIIKNLKTKKFWRLRIGIRKASLSAEAPRPKAEDFVLKKISAFDYKKLERVFKEARTTIGNNEND